MALGLVYRWPAALILLKPSLLPFALIGIRDPRWWITAAVIAGVTFLGPWRDYITVIQNGADSGGPLYSIWQVPLMLIPIIAWIGRSDRDRQFVLHQVRNGQGRASVADDVVVAR